MINAFEVHEDASGMDYGKPAPTEHHPYSARDGAGASSVASDSKQAAQAAKSDTQPHSRRGRGMGAESTSSLTKIGDIDKQSVDAGQQPATAADVQAIKSAATAAVGKKRAAKVEVLTRDEVGQRSGLERLIGDTSEQQQANGMRKAMPKQAVFCKHCQTKATTFCTQMRLGGAMVKNNCPMRVMLTVF